MVKIGPFQWKEFPLMLAPMDDISNPPFRVLCKEHGADLMFTEFIAAEGLIREIHNSRKKLNIYPEERPIGIQIFGSEEERMCIAADIVEQASPDFLDINYGCPVKKIALRGAGAGILRDIPKMQKMTATIVKQVNLPVTVKTRLGWDNSDSILEVAQRLQDVGIQALTIHGRTRKQMYQGKADWEAIAKVKNHPSIVIPIIGNGDVDGAEKAMELHKKYQLDGIMIGRAAIGNPWIFNEIKHFRKTGTLLTPPSLSTRISTIEKHLKLSIAWEGEKIAIYKMRKYYSGYLRGVKGIKEFRKKLITANSVEEINSLLTKKKEIF